MKVLIVGGGGREFGLVWAVQRSARVTEVLAAPGNPGMASLARCVPVAADDLAGLVALAKSEKVGLVIVGPELPLTLGLVDELLEAGIPAFGPSRAAAQLEGSKTFAKDFMQRHHIPTARYRVCRTLAEAEGAIGEFGAPVVVKADGLAAGKGVTVATSREQALAAVNSCLADKVFGAAGEQLVIEECLVGEEASVLAFCDGERVVPMLAAQDHKRVFDADQGPNTGGMGAYAPAPVVTEALLEQIQREVLEPTVAGMAAEGAPYKGVLYAGLIMTAQGPKVIEFNCRFGDPETQVILPLLETDLVEIALACVAGNLDETRIWWKTLSAVCVVLAAGGYPGEFSKGQAISGIDAAQKVPGVMVWHAATATRDGQFVTAGGRVLSVIAVGDDLPQAVERVYAAAEKIKFDHVHYRRDIAARALKRL
jgi:phosphoribosylamine--glycine ligase